MPVVHTPTKPALDVRILILPAIIFASLLVLLVRLWYVQVVLGPRLSRQAHSFGKTYSTLLAPRGMIVDRNGKTIAGVQSALVLTGRPAVLLKNLWVLDKLASELRACGVNAADPSKMQRKLRQASDKPYVPTPIYTGVPVRVAGEITESPDHLPGIGLEEEPLRYYPDSRSFSQLLGYVWIPSADDLARADREKRKPSTFVGKGGVEWLRESELAGDDGYDAMFVDRRRRPVSLAERSSPIPGSELILGLDAELQRVAIKGLAGRSGAVAAVEPATGEVLCLASTPTFDLSLFQNGISQADFDRLNKSPGHPFINRPIGSAFSPGSCFKIVTSVAAMRAGVFDPNRTVFCDGGYRLGKQFFGCLGHHGAISYREALEKSCNTYFSDLAVRTGKDELRQTALDMGFFSKAGIDLPGERSGLIPTDAWLKRVGRHWLPGYTVLTGIGQGDVLTTPLQMADMAAMVANSGVIYKPHLVRAIRETQSGVVDAVKPEVFRKVDLPQTDWGYIQQAMVGVVEHGTAAGSRIPGLFWAGKTGSAEVKGQNKTNSWFVGYAPADHPRIAICVMVEDAGHGGEIAAPIAKAVVERYLIGK